MSGLVSVVIPAYNAAATIDETLRSVRAQTHRELDIVLVDDGSTDATLAIATRHAGADPRIRLLTQANAGVATARNNGWTSARSDLIAFLDADDLWAPTKIEKQLRCMEAADDRVGLVYCWFREIDENGTVVGIEHRPTCRGDVLETLLQGNFIGNGSAALVRRAVLERTQGFEDALRRNGAHGCEDILFYLRAAHDFRFDLVEEVLVGYRVTDTNMSSDKRRMLRSWLMVAEEMDCRHPEQRKFIEAGIVNYIVWLFDRCFQERNFRTLGDLAGIVARRRPAAIHSMVMKSLGLVAKRSLRSVLGSPQFSRVRSSAPRRFEIGERQ